MTLRLPKPLKSAIEKEAKKQDLTASQFARRYFAKLLSMETKPRKARKLKEAAV